MMDRREALKRTAILMGTAVSASTVAGIMQGCAAEAGVDWNPVFFSSQQALLITEMAETIIPKTDTPGAKEAGVPKFIEDMVSAVLEDQEKEEFMAGLDAFVMTCEAEKGNDFVSLSSSERLSYLQAYNDEMQEMMRTGVRKAPKPDMQFFRRMKELTVVGFFTSQPGATQVLQYSAIPTQYNGCISLEEAGGKTWAT